MKRHELDSIIENSINKVSGVNKPFRAIRRTEEYKKFESTFAEAINDQAKWVSDNIDNLFSSADVADDLSKLSLDQEQKIKGQLMRDMPAISTLIPEFRLFQNLKSFFEWSAVQQYKRWGYVAKYDGIEFTLTNVNYINSLKDRASYLLNQSSLDSTTIDQILSLIIDARTNGMTTSEVATMLKDKFDDISQYRADMITRTEAANSMGAANYATAKQNGAQTKHWVTAGEGDDEICAGNADAGDIPIDQPFPSGHMYEPGHPNCECYTEAGLIDLDSIDLWDGS